MTIVELVDSHQGFKIITDRITTKNKIKLLWALCFVAFFFSAVLDNLTTAIVMAALLQKIIKSREQLLIDFDKKASKFCLSTGTGKFNVFKLNVTRWDLEQISP